MIEKTLTNYNIKGEFTFKPNESLIIKCNAPTNYSGIYLIYYKEEIIYIGSSGQKINGELKTRKCGIGGMKDRIVNGFHPKFDKIKRKKIFPLIMKELNMDEITFKWYVTYDYTNNFDFPTDIEKKILNQFKSTNENQKPSWHK